ncbi:DUF2007 domain-containing protein [Polaribacter sp. Z022]|uniref:DUF2007 domain-containing protein n=1 Tax=Polaribacter sp. Z022 TaxID=2927125 RepID=UPI00201FDF47|nr:DUF2007 domain-containing protein [Polaribacter sp. Z022]MCL7753773.1 DUF2007 domain-containing protein [Polaribacter sp. Z022]
MKDNYTKVLTDTTIIIKGLQTILSEAKIDYKVLDSVESGRLAGFGVPINSVQLYVLNNDLKKAQPIIDSYKEEINS